MNKEWTPTTHIDHLIVACRGGEYGNYQLYKDLHGEILPDAEMYIHNRADNINGLGKFLTPYPDDNVRTIAIIDAPALTGTEVTVETTLIGIINDFHGKVLCVVHVDSKYSHTLRILPGAGYNRLIDPDYYNPAGPQNLIDFLNAKYPFIFIVQSTGETVADVLREHFIEFRNRFDEIWAENKTPEITVTA